MPSVRLNKKGKEQAQKALKELFKTQGEFKKQAKQDGTTVGQQQVSNFFNGGRVADQTARNFLKLLKLEDKFEEYTEALSYVERPPIESNCYNKILKPGALLRIKAPQQMGKSSLTQQILDRAEEQGYQTVNLSFGVAGKGEFQDFERFLQWFCVTVTRNLAEQMAEENEEWLHRSEREWYSQWQQNYWSSIFAPMQNATDYFEKELLAKLTNPLVLALDKVDLVFEQPNIADDFCKLLRYWNDLPKREDRHSEIWQKLRLVIVHATNVYGALDLNSSPLAGVGATFTLPEFDKTQVSDLAEKYGLRLNPTKIKELMDMVGGHPYLLEVAFKESKHQNTPLEKLLETAPTQAGIYSNHLGEHLKIVNNNPALKKALQEVVKAENPISVNQQQAAFQLEQIGLIKLVGNKAQPRCQLYRLYFRHYLGN
jgi:AAA-like domain